MEVGRGRGRRGSGRGEEKVEPKVFFSAEAFVLGRRYRKVCQTCEDLTSEEEDCRRLEIKEKVGEVTLLSVFLSVCLLYLVRICFLKSLT